MPSQDRSLPTWWLKIWIVIGCFAFALFVGVPVLMSHDIKVEYDRFQACVAHHTDDCKPSMIWLLSGWSVASSTNTGVVSMNSAPTSTPSTVASSTNSGSLDAGGTTNTVKLVSLELVNATVVEPRDASYSITKGVPLKLKVQTQNAKRVELFAVDNSPSSTGMTYPHFVSALTAGKNGVFTGTWNYPKNYLSLDLEVHAYASSTGSKDINATFDYKTATVAIKK